VDKNNSDLVARSNFYSLYGFCSLYVEDSDVVLCCVFGITENCQVVGTSDNKELDEFISDHKFKQKSTNDATWNEWISFDYIKMKEPRFTDS